MFRTANSVPYTTAELAKNTRAKSGLAQRDFCERIGLSRNMLKRWETGEKNMTRPTMALFALLWKRPELFDVLEELNSTWLRGLRPEVGAT